jgi:cytoskeletal protein CcmA (bactofilin family)
MRLVLRMGMVDMAGNDDKTGYFYSRVAPGRKFSDEHCILSFFKIYPMFTRKEDEPESSVYAPTSGGVSGTPASHSSQTPVSKPASGREMNIISKGTYIQGDLNCDGDLRIDGEVKGIIRSRSKIMIGPEGFVNGDVECVHAEVLGRVKGSLKVQDHLYLRGNAKMEGDVLTTHFEMEPSVRFNGKCTMQDKVELSAVVKRDEKPAVTRDEKPAAIPVSGSRTGGTEKPLTGSEKTNGEKDNKAANGIFQKQAV